MERKLFLMRHGERVDFAFGSWIPFSFDESGKYVRKDLNMPYVLPERKQGPKAYYKDTPLTNIGIYQATLVGQGLKDANTSIQHVYCSPSFRCIQTCDAVLQGCGRKEQLQIRVIVIRDDLIAFNSYLNDFRSNLLCSNGSFGIRISSRTGLHLQNW